MILQFCFLIVEGVGLGLYNCIKEIFVVIFVLVLVFKEFKNGINVIVGIFF